MTLACAKWNANPRTQSQGWVFLLTILLTNLIPISDVLLPLCILTRLETQLVDFRPLISLVTVRSIGFPDRFAQNIT